MGREAYESQIYPILEGKFGAYAKQVNMAWMWARVKYRTFTLGTYEGGFQAFFDALAGAVQKAGAQIRYGARVTAIARGADGLGGLTVDTGADSAAFDRVLVTTSPRLLTRLAPALPADYLATLNALKSLGAVVAVFVLDRQLSTQGHYWHSLPKSAGSHIWRCANIQTLCRPNILAATTSSIAAITCRPGTAISLRPTARSWTTTYPRSRASIRRLSRAG